MATLRLTDEALDSIASISAYIGQASGARAGERFLSQILDRCEQLAALPGTMGRARPELQNDLRSSVFKGYLIFFRYQGDWFEVVDILEGHRDIEGYFSAGES
jgi:plasmid stabilization system protein ParE